MSLAATHNPSISMAASIVRRSLFLCALLCIGSATQFLSGNITSGSSTGWVAVATFLWGFNSIGIVLAAWLAARSGIWSTWLGRLRVAAYIAAFTYGEMLFSATQNTSATSPFCWPGKTVDDYASPMLGLLRLLILVWILMPLFALCPGTLAAKNAELERRKSVSIAALLGWTTVAAAIMFFFGFITSDAAPETWFRGMSPAQAMWSYLADLPFEALLAFVAVAGILAWTGKWWLPIITFIVAFVFVVFGEHLTAWAIERLTGNANDAVYRGPQRYSYIAGTVALMWIAFGISALTGVSFRWYDRDITNERLTSRGINSDVDAG